MQNAVISGHIRDRRHSSGADAAHEGDLSNAWQQLSSRKLHRAHRHPRRDLQAIGYAGESAILQDLSLLFYMRYIESIEMASFKSMMMVAAEMYEPGIEQLLLECYDEAREDKALFTAIMSNYL